MDKNTFGERIKNIRIEKGLKQRDVADILNCAPTSLTNYEKGIINPPLDVLARLCEALEISALDLLEKRYTFNDILEILDKPANERSYEEQVALNFSHSILKKQKPTELRRLETERENKDYISKKTGLSFEAVEALTINNDFFFDYDENKISSVGLEALNKLLSCPQGLKVLDNIAIYLRAGNFRFTNGEKKVEVNVGEFTGKNFIINESFYFTPDMTKSIALSEFLRLLDEIRTRLPKEEIESIKHKENLISTKNHSKNI